MNTALLWWRAIRPFSLTVSFIPPVLGGIIAFLQMPNISFNWFHFFLTVVGCMVAHAASNLLSDYFDFKNKVDRKGTFGSSGVLVDNVLSPSTLLKGAWILYGTAGITGLYLILSIPNGLFLLWLVILGGVLGVFYTAEPFAFKYHALGDIAVFISFGSAMTLGAFFVQTQQFSWIPVLYAIPLALLVDAVLHSNNLRDIANDKKVNIKTLAIILGEKSSKWFYYALICGAYIITILYIITGIMPLLASSTLLTIPLAMKLVNKVAHKDDMDASAFAMIDANTAQLHTAFGGLLVLSLVLSNFINISV